MLEPAFVIKKAAGIVTFGVPGLGKQDPNLLTRWRGQARSSSTSTGVRVCMYVCFCPAAVCREAHLKHLPRWMATSAAAVRVAVGKNKTKNKGFSHLHPHRRSRERDWVWFWFVLHIPNVGSKEEKAPLFPYAMLCRYLPCSQSVCNSYMYIYIYIYLHPSASSGIETPVEREGGDGRRSGDETRKVGGSM